MRRLLLLLSVAAAGAGCGGHRDVTPRCDVPGSIAFYWNFRDGQGATYGNFTPANPGCGDVGVDGIDVIVGGVTYQVNCTNLDQAGQQAPAIGTGDLWPGNYPYTVRGFRGAERVFETSGTTSVGCNALTQQDATLQALSPQSMVVFYTFGGTTGCPAGTTLTYELYTYPPGAAPVASSAGFSCSATNEFTLPVSLAFGSYSLRFLEATDSAGHLYKSCGSTLVHGGAVQTVNLSYDPTSTLCP